jgi:hypothetical protein
MRRRRRIIKVARCVFEVPDRAADLPAELGQPIGTDATATHERDG